MRLGISHSIHANAKILCSYAKRVKFKFPISRNDFVKIYKNNEATKLSSKLHIQQISTLYNYPVHKNLPVKFSKMEIHTTENHTSSYPPHGHKI